MALAQNIVLADAQATPVNHTFVPMGKDAAGVYWYEDQSAPSAVGYWRVSADFRRPLPAAPGASSETSRVYRVKISLHEPVLENITNAGISGILPAPTVAYIVRSMVEFLVPERSSLQNRKDIRKMLPLLLSSQMVIDAVETLQPPF